MRGARSRARRRRLMWHADRLERLNAIGVRLGEMLTSGRLDPDEMAKASAAARAEIVALGEEAPPWCDGNLAGNREDA